MRTLTTVRTFVVVALVGAASSASAEFRHERSLSLERGGTFLLDADVGSVDIIGDMSSGASIAIVSRNDDFERRYAIGVEERTDGVTIRIKRRGGGLAPWRWRGWSDDTTIRVRVPRSTSATVSTAGGAIRASQLGNARLRTSGGSIQATNFAGESELRTSGGAITARSIGGNLQASTSGGGIRVESVRGFVRASTSGGPIDVESVTGDVDANTSGGGIAIRGAGGRVEAHTSGGPIVVAFSPKNARGGDLSTSGGGVGVSIDPSVALSIDASSSGGEVRADVPITIRGTLSQRTLQGELNGGGQILRMRSSGGGIRITGSN